jgi:hypothetical protein
MGVQGGGSPSLGLPLGEFAAAAFDLRRNFSIDCFSFLRFFSSPSPQRWQNSQLAAWRQPSGWWNQAQGLQPWRPCWIDPKEGMPGGRTASLPVGTPVKTGQLLMGRDICFGPEKLINVFLTGKSGSWSAMKGRHAELRISLTRARKRVRSEGWSSPRGSSPLLRIAKSCTIE